MIDNIDIQILDILQSNGRMRRNNLADQVGLSLPSVSERLHKLEDKGYIKGYSVIVDHRKLGKDITAFITVMVDSSKHYPKFIENTKAHDEILECHAITGEGSHLLKIRTENTTSLEKLLSVIQAWQGVLGTKTHLVLSTSKETTKIKLPNIK